MRTPVSLILLMCVLMFFTSGKKSVKVNPEVVADSVINDSIKQLHDSITHLYTVLEDIRQNRDFFKNKYTNTVMSDIMQDNEYLKSSFTSIDPMRLQDMVEKYIPCKDIPAFSQMLNQIRITSENKRLYEHVVYLISDKGPDFNPDLPLSLKSALDSLVTPLSNTQQSEVEVLAESIRLYPDAVTKFQNTISHIVRQLDREEAKISKDFKDAIQDDIDNYFSTPKYKNYYNFRISKIPHLDTLYKEWTAELKKDILSPRAIEIENHILSFKVEEPPTE